MSRYIDADMFLCRNSYYADRKFVNTKYSDTLRDLINAMPSADVVEVVRCKDCKWNYEPYDPHALCTNPKLCDPLEQDDFCKYGDRTDE